MRLLSRLIAPTLLAGILFSATSRADQITQTVTFAQTQTDITFVPLVFNKFDPLLGTLNSISITMMGLVSGASQAENLTSSAATIIMNLQADLTLMVPSSTTVLSAAPRVQTINMVSAYDSVLDFRGTSGVTNTGLSGTATTTTTTSIVNDITQFTGPGTIGLLFSARGDSSGSGAGSLVLNFSTSAGATVTVIYNFLKSSEIVPEPASLALFGCGGAIVLASIHRRRNNLRVKNSA